MSPLPAPGTPGAGGTAHTEPLRAPAETPRPAVPPGGGTTDAAQPSPGAAGAPAGGPLPAVPPPLVHRHLPEPDLPAENVVAQWRLPIPGLASPEQEFTPIPGLVPGVTPRQPQPSAAYPGEVPTHEETQEGQQFDAAPPERREAMPEAGGPREPSSEPESEGSGLPPVDTAVTEAPQPRAPFPHFPDVAAPLPPHAPGETHAFAGGRPTGHVLFPAHPSEEPALAAPSRHPALRHRLWRRFLRVAGLVPQSEGSDPDGTSPAAARVGGELPGTSGAGPRRRLAPPPVDGRPHVTKHEVPPAVSVPFRQLHGVDVHHVPVIRGPLAGRMARALGARAATHRGHVFLPDEVGSLDGMPAQALLAHELVHHVQQRHSAAVPGESSPAGRHQEAQAVATEQWFRGAPAPLAHLRLPAAQAASPVVPEDLHDYVREVVHQVTEHRDGDVRETVQRAPEATAAAVMAPPVDARAGGWASPPGPSASSVPLSPAVAESLRKGESVVVRPSSDGLTGVAETLADISRAAPESAPVRVLSEQTEQELRDTLRELRESGRRAVNMRSARDLDELAWRLYDRISAGLRSELLVDRERFGLLADFR